MENNIPVTEAELAEWQALCDAVRDQRSPYWQADRDRLATFAAPALIAEVRRLKNDFDTRVNALVDDETADLHAESVLLGDRARNAVARAEAAEAKLAAANAMAVEAERQRDKLVSDLVSRTRLMNGRWLGNSQCKLHRSVFDTREEAIASVIEWAAQKDGTV